jgi:uncharacterized membrane protein YjjP (DUF1212 family)
LDVALVVMEHGGSAVMADRAFRGILDGHGKQADVSTLWRSDFVAVTRSVNGENRTTFRPLEAGTVDLRRVYEAVVLADRVAKGTTGVTEIADELRKCKELAAPYHPGWTIVASATAAACFAEFIGGDWGSFPLCLAAGAVGQSVRLVLNARGLGTAPVTLICAMLSASIGALGVRAGLSATAAPVLIGSVGYMIPGLLLVNGFIDVGTYRYLSVGAGRIAGAAFLFVLMAIGIAVAESLLG